MKKYLLSILAVTFFATPSFAQKYSDHWNEKDIAYRKNIAEKFKKWIPKGWFIESVAEGDLNGDNIPDIAFVAGDLDLDNPGDIPYETRLHSKILVFINEGNDYSLLAQNSSYVDGRSMTPRGRPEALLEIDKGVLSVRVGTPAPWFAGKHLFRMEDERLRLIGVEYSHTRSALGVDETVSYNFLTGKCEEKVEFFGNPSEKTEILSELKLREGSVWKRIRGNRKIYFGGSEDGVECR